MKLRIKALRSLRWNYKRRGVWVWLKGRKRCQACGDSGGNVLQVEELRRRFQCFDCNGKTKRGYQRILSEPKQVIAEQEAAAEGVMV